jgi:pimeloyl-ACP methyl ester carboxylesterase
VRRTVPPSAEIEAQIERLLAVGVGENPRESLSELARQGARLIIQRASRSCAARADNRAGAHSARGHATRRTRPQQAAVQVCLRGPVAGEKDGASGLDAASRVHEIAIPVIVACGELDVAIKVRRSAELASALPNAADRSLPGRAHLPYPEAPDEIAALILSEAV